ncbi:MAG: pilus assembly protein PilM [Puniceicoccales bacterium]|jgi:type IV pilus assembly protein PilM|nr:pilus assembly protein PilM [Puniceicoccales bacterium]
MSSATPIVVNCGATHVSVSVFSSNNGTLKLERFLVQPLAYNYANEEEWLDTLAVPLRGIVRSMNLSGPATVIVPGYRLLTKNIKVPKVEESRQRQIIAYEAQRNLPDATEMVWDGQIIASDGVEAEVALFAHRTVDAVRFVDTICTTGLRPEIVDAATLLDYQAYQLANREIEEDVLLVNVGARSTNLTFASSVGFNIQNITVGGNLLTQAIADSLGEKFRAAEMLKIQYFSAPGNTNSSDPLAPKLDAQAQAFSRRLAQEISRRIVIYKRQPHGRVPTKILLTGRASLLPGLSARLCESLRLPVDYFDPTLPLQIGPHVQADLLAAFRFQMSESVGGAARLVLPKPVGVNLLPAQVAERIAFSRKKPILALAAMLFAATPLPAGWFLWNANKEISAKTNLLKAENQIYSANKNKIDAERQSALESASRAYNLAYGYNAWTNGWPSFLSELQTVLVQNPLPDSTSNPAADEPADEAPTHPPNHVWIESLTVRRSPGTPPAPPTNKDAPQQVPPLIVPRVTITIVVCALLPEIAPDAPLNSQAINHKFKIVEDALKKCDVIETVEPDAANNDMPNLPKRTFKLTIKPEYPL